AGSIAAQSLLRYRRVHAAQLGQKQGACPAMTERRFHILDGFPRSVSPSSHAAEADGFVFLTGQFGRDLYDPDKPLPDGIRAQTDRSLRNMSRVLGALGLSMGQVLRVRVFLTHFKRDYD